MAERMAERPAPRRVDSTAQHQLATRCMPPLCCIPPPPPYTHLRRPSTSYHQHHAMNRVPSSNYRHAIDRVPSASCPPCSSYPPGLRWRQNPAPSAPQDPVRPHVHARHMACQLLPHGVEPAPAGHDPPDERRMCTAHGMAASTAWSGRSPIRASSHMASASALSHSPQSQPSATTLSPQPQASA